MKTPAKTPKAKSPTAATPQPEPKAQSIKLGIDVHQKKYVVVRQIDNARPQPAQSFTPEGFLRWLDKQKSKAHEVWACYEAGPFGYHLYRQMEAMGIHALVVCPQNWDERGKGVKTDKTDAKALAIRLDRYVQGNHDALALVRVPSEEEEQARCESRQREQLLRERKRLEMQGQKLCLSQGVEVGAHWWGPLTWKQVRKTLPAYLEQLLARIRPILLAIYEQLQSLTKKLEEAAANDRPRGFGALSTEVLDREVVDWNRFANRRQVASYTGMCPGQHSSGGRTSMGSITKHGNPRVRVLLIEMVWRLFLHQPDYKPLKKWKKVFADRQATRAARKKAAVAIGRQLAVDLWRLKTGRTSADKLGLVMS